MEKKQITFVTGNVPLSIMYIHIYIYIYIAKEIRGVFSYNGGRHERI